MDHHYIYMILIELIHPIKKSQKFHTKKFEDFYILSKANPNKEIIKKFKNLKCEFEVPSIGEVKKKF